MEDMLSFVSEKVKQSSGLTMRELVSASGMTKSKFYRYMQEPWRLSREQMENIEHYLYLSDEEKEMFYQFYSRDEKKRSEQEKNFLNQILFNSWPIESDLQSKFYTLFDTTAQNNKIARLSSRELTDALRQWIDRLNLPPKGHFLNFRIINCLNSNKIKQIFSFLTLLQELDYFSNFNSLIYHIIGSDNMTLEDKLRSIRITNSLYRLSNYSVEYVPLNDGMWSDFDFCIAEYSHNNQQKMIITIIFPSDTDALVYFSTERLLFDYLTYNSESIFKFEAKHTYVQNEVFALNRFFAQAVMEHSRVLIGEELCYDCFCTELWEETKLLLSQHNEMIRELRLFADPRDELSPFSNEQFIEYLIKSFNHRYLLNEASRGINILSPAGLKRFAYTGTLKDFEFFNFRFTEDQVIRELQNIKERLGDHRSEKRQSYLIMSPTCKINYHGLTIFKDYCFYYDSGDYQSSKTLSSGGTQQPEIATLLYDYIVDKILPNSCRKSFASPVMSDEQAIEFVDSLIDGVRTRIRSDSEL